MAYEPKPGQFSLFKNDKEGNEARPDYRGDGMDLAGNAIKVSAWLKKGQKGTFMSCKFELKDPIQAAARTQPSHTKTTQAPAPASDFLDDDIPF